MKSDIPHPSSLLPSSGIILIVTTVARPEDAKAFADGLIEQHLAACVTCLPKAVSHFRWESEAVSEETEIVLLIKSHRDKLAEIESYFGEHHPYDVPELLAFDAAVVADGYAKWLREELKL